MWYQIEGPDPYSARIKYATSLDGLSWVQYGTVLDTGGVGSWDSLAATSPSVLYDGTTFKMWYAGYGNAFPVYGSVGYATSSDGIHWTKYAGNPVLVRGRNGGWDDFNIGYDTVFHNGTHYLMWYVAQQSVDTLDRTGIATSIDGVSWTKYAHNPVLVSGPSGRWDDRHAEAGSVLWNGSHYVMWWAGQDWATSTTKIGLATSPDGFSWTKYAQPVLEPGPSGSWDARSVWNPCVIQRGATLLMFYNGYESAPPYSARLGLATSTISLTVASDCDSPSPSGTTYPAYGTSITASVSSPVAGPTGTQYVCTGWTGTGDIPASGTGTSVTFTITQDSSITWNWKTQYYLTVTSPYGVPTGQGWYDSGLVADFGASTPISGGTGTQYVFTGWSSSDSGGYTGSQPSYSVTMSNPITETASWNTQYYLTVDSGGHGTASGQAWYDAGTGATFSIDPTTVSGGAGIRYVFTGWSSSDNGGYTGPIASQSVTMNNPITETAHWKTQYYLTVGTAQSGLGTISGTGWYDQGHTVTLTAPIILGGYRLITIPFSWDIDGTSQGVANPLTISMNSAHTATAHYVNPSIGGEWAPITLQALSPMNALQLAPWIALTLVAAASAIFAHRRLLKKRW
jgi:uncharacterized repeat protein (TIGR02543 family)